MENQYGDEQELQAKLPIKRSLKSQNVYHDRIGPDPNNEREIKRQNLAEAAIPNGERTKRGKKQMSLEPRTS